MPSAQGCRGRLDRCGMRKRTARQGFQLLQCHFEMCCNNSATAKPEITKVTGQDRITKKELTFKCETGFQIVFGIESTDTPQRMLSAPYDTANFYAYVGNFRLDNPLDAGHYLQFNVNFAYEWDRLRTIMTDVESQDKDVAYTCDAFAKCIDSCGPYLKKDADPLYARSNYASHLVSLFCQRGYFFCLPEGGGARKRASFADKGLH